MLAIRSALIPMSQLYFTQKWSRSITAEADDCCSRDTSLLKTMDMLGCCAPDPISGLEVMGGSSPSSAQQLSAILRLMQRSQGRLRSHLSLDLWHAWQARRTVPPLSHETHESATPFSTHRWHGRSSSHLIFSFLQGRHARQTWLRLPRCLDAPVPPEDASGEPYMSPSSTVSAGWGRLLSATSKLSLRLIPWMPPSSSLDTLRFRAMPTPGIAPPAAAMARWDPGPGAKHPGPVRNSSGSSLITDPGYPSC
mmetsp:Transcript_42229/g.103481  ORF Transcript_42229/g.103481 Transcript_42229/m.103481 type:complete len:252 (+) Transcript_42229:2655-3410(+)